jgi:hypothetical protein
MPTGLTTPSLERQAVCRNFVIRHMILGTDRDSVDLGSPRCCCGNTICEVSDGGMVARSILDINAQGTFRFVINGEVTAEPVPFDGGNLIVQAFGNC